MKSSSREREKEKTRERNIGRLREALAAADTVLIGAGAGLSTSAGFTYDGDRFEKYFRIYRRRYGFRDMYAGGFYPYETPEERWAYWTRYIIINRYMDAPLPAYDDLPALVCDKDYFVLTTNVDHMFQKTGFDKARLFYTQGDYGLFQCSVPCSQETYDNEAAVREMADNIKDYFWIPTELFPKCPRCGAPMTMNLRSDDKFVEDEGWHRAAARYDAFLESHFGEGKNGKTILLELGVGYNTPGIIKFPFWQLARENDDVVYACVNYGQADAPEELGERAICIDGDIGEVLKELKR